MESAATSTIEEPRSAPGFVQGLGLFDASTIVMRSMIGSGIFIVAPEIARGLTIVALGTPVFLFWRNRAENKAAAVTMSSPSAN